MDQLAAIRSVRPFIPPVVASWSIRPFVPPLAARYLVPDAPLVVDLDAHVTELLLHRVCVLELARLLLGEASAEQLVDLRELPRPHWGVVGAGTLVVGAAALAAARWSVRPSVPPLSARWFV